MRVVVSPKYQNTSLDPFLLFLESFDMCNYANYIIMYDGGNFEY